MIDAACETPMADHVKRFWELVRTPGAVVSVATPNPQGFDTAYFASSVVSALAAANLARGGEGVIVTDQPKGGDAIARSICPDETVATSPGRECGPAGASEELCKRLGELTPRVRKEALEGPKDEE